MIVAVKPPSYYISRSYYRNEIVSYSWWDFLRHIVASVVVDVIAWLLGKAVGIATTFITGSPALGLIAGGATKTAISIAGNILLDYFTDNLYNKDGSVNWTNITLSVIPALGSGGLSQVKQGVGLLKKEKLLVKSLKEWSSSFKFLHTPLPKLDYNKIRKYSNELFDMHFGIRKALKVNDIEYGRMYVRGAKRARIFETKQILKKVYENEKFANLNTKIRSGYTKGRLGFKGWKEEYQFAHSQAVINFLSVKVQSTITTINLQNKTLKSYLVKLLESKRAEKVYKIVDKSLNIVKYLSPTYAIRKAISKTLLPLEKTIKHALKPYLKKITKFGIKVLNAYKQYGLIPSKSSVILGYQVKDHSLGMFQIKFWFRPEATNGKKPILSRPLPSYMLYEFATAPSQMGWYLDNVAFSRGGRQKGGTGLFENIPKILRNIGGVYNTNTLLNKYALLVFKGYRAYSYMRRFGTQKKEWQGFGYLKDNVLKQYKNTLTFQNALEHTKRQATRKFARIILGSGFASRTASILVRSKDKKKRKFANTRGEKIIQSQVSNYRTRLRKRIRRQKII